MSEHRDERRSERHAASGFVVSALASAALAVLYWRGGQPQLEGALLAVAFGAMGYGFVIWANRLLPQGPFEEKRHTLVAEAAEWEAIEEDIERGGELGRRTLLVRALATAAGALGVAMLFPIRSLGPNPGKSLLRTSWKRGSPLVTEDGRRVRAADVPVDGLVTVFPEGHAGSADSQAVLMRVAPGLIVAVDGRETWAPEGLIAYSKVCTHAGCPVGLYQPDTHQLLCPCHQSAFDVLNGAKPVFGPAAWPLPQLPLHLDPDGILRARGDFSEPIGPGYWKEK
jgi:ubiquinol-cytochrome c reductase iron-sulfur subunit